jgi:pyruvate carboxylase
VKVYTKVGQEVKKGDPILLLEAMKMKNKILFSMDGKVKSIKVKEGERVPKDHLMLEMA